MNPRVRWPLLVFAAACLVMGAAGAATDPGEASGGGVSCNPRWHVVPMSGWKRRDTTLFGLSGVSAGNVWAVGDRYVAGRRAPLIAHWNGHRWAVTPSPKIKGFRGGYTELQGVAGNSASDAWAVGFREVPTGRRSRTLIEHWNGRHWRIQASPNMTDGRNDLHAVTVISSHDAWAVGGWIPAETGDWRQLILHWDGTAWTISRNSLTGELLSASAAADGDVWAGGYESGTDSVVVHEAGGTWNVATTSGAGDSVDSITAIPPHDVWAVGDTGATHPFALHWDGTKWGTMRTAAPISGSLRATAGSASNDVWAFGYRSSSKADIPYIEHWDGKRWLLSRAPVAESDFVASIALSRTNVWAIGNRLSAGPVSLHYGCSA